MKRDKYGDLDQEDAEFDRLIPDDGGEVTMSLDEDRDDELYDEDDEEYYDDYEEGDEDFVEDPWDDEDEIEDDDDLEDDLDYEDLL